ncbi:hypothetical protein [Henriciella aquimarina]|uniref:hypothetical protein n=1 Tax=Henriciella aquimarina TaxID=545261 RepID=UPI00146F8BCE|nr:hypothetical protein [Henriciella aquimarina]
MDLKNSGRTRTGSDASGSPERLTLIVREATVSIHGAMCASVAIDRSMELIMNRCTVLSSSHSHAQMKVDAHALIKKAVGSGV